MDEVADYNIKRWKALAQANALFTRPYLQLDAAAARAKIDPEGRLGEPAVRVGDGHRPACRVDHETQSIGWTRPSAGASFNSDGLDCRQWDGPALFSERSSFAPRHRLRVPIENELGAFDSRQGWSLAQYWPTVT